MVRATGRRPDARQSKVKWIGLKAHARHATLAADLEMHFVPDGYVGLCQLGGAVNVCGLFAVRGPVPQLAERWPEFLRGPTGSALRERLRNAEFMAESFCAMSGFNLRPSSAVEMQGCCVGDALGMIPPVTGNGMSMAFESAAWSAEPLAAYSRGEMSWDEARLEIARLCDAGFARRVRWAAWLQLLLMRQGSREFLLALASRFDWLWRAVFDRTR
jgi:flavin-dependent dehydrogenase